jgi:transposase-like protein
MKRRTEYSSDGPKCPGCGFTFTPDDTYYYDPLYVEDTCQECGLSFNVEVEHSVCWRTSEKVADGEDRPR